MSKLTLQKTEVVARDGTPVRLVYDEEADILDIFFGENGPASGIELTDYMILRLNKTEKRVVSLMLRHFSVLSEQTEYGPRSFPLDKLEKIARRVKSFSLAANHFPPCQSVFEVITSSNITHRTHSGSFCRIAANHSLRLKYRRRCGL